MENMAVQWYSTALVVATSELRPVRTRANEFHRDKRCLSISLCARLHKHFSQGSLNKLIEGNIMATKDKSTESVYRVTEVIGTSAQSWEDAAKAAVKTAAETLRDLRIAEVVKMDVKIENGKVLEFRTRLQLSFKYEG
jgi:dodecin